MNTISILSFINELNNCKLDQKMNTDIKESYHTYCIFISFNGLSKLSHLHTICLGTKENEILGHAYPKSIP